MEHTVHNIRRHHIITICNPHLTTNRLSLRRIMLNTRGDRLPFYIPVCQFSSQSFKNYVTYISHDLLRFSSSRAAEHIGQQLVASMIGLKPCPPPHSMSNEPVSGCLLLHVFFGWDDLFYMFVWLVSISLPSWNADYWEDVVRCLPDGIYVLLLCLVVMWIRPFSRLPHW